MTTNVLFLCPHSAGKSVFASTYFRAAAARIGVNATADVAGTDPDAEVMANVRAALEAQGFGITDKPKLVSSSDTDSADIVVSIGCSHDEIPAASIIEWDVPMLSNDFSGSMNAIHRHVELLVHSLSESP